MKLQSIFPYSLYELLDFEIYILLINFCLICFLFYRFFLKTVSQERHESLRGHFKNIFNHIIILTILYALFNLCKTTNEPILQFKILPYLAVLTYLSGVILVIKSFRLFTLQYLFLGSMRAGVPLLIVNIISLLLSILIIFASLSKIFGIDLTPVLATSAAFSVVLGFALQDTLGNLFAGITLQIDKTFELDDWIEVTNGNSKISGQVNELSWRSTVLISLTDEIITLPNKLVAASQVSNFSLEKGSFIRSQVFRIKYQADIENLKKLLAQEISTIPELDAKNPPFAYIQDINENWVSLKMIYWIEKYGRQFLIGDQVYQKVLNLFAKNNIEWAHQIIEFHKDQK